MTTARHRRRSRMGPIAVLLGALLVAGGVVSGDVPAPAPREAARVASLLASLPAPLSASLPGEARPTRALLQAHVSMQFSDTRAEQLHDARAVMAYGPDVITGTEAAASSTRGAIREAARAYGYRLYFGGSSDSWVAVDRELIRPGSWASGYERVLPGGGGRGYAEKGVTGVAFDSVHGRVAVLTAHYLTARTSGAGAENARLASRIDYWGGIHAAQGIALYGGDQNLQDRHADTFLGGSFLSTWDEVRKWPGTGHGCIDVIASHRRDPRVSPAAGWVLRDGELYLHTDHFLILTRWTIDTPVR